MARATLVAVKGRSTHVPQKGGNIAALAAAAHELKSPLTLVQHIASTLRDEELDLSPQERAHYLDRLQFTSERMLRFVHQLAVSYRLDDDRQLAFQFPVEPLSATEVCETAAHELRLYAREYDQEIRIPSRRPQMVVANREILHDIVTNLVDNAIRHNPPGGIIAITAQARTDVTRLSVQDQGPGMSAHDLARLGKTLGTQPQPFSGDSGTSGLGLYIVGQFASAMGGRLGLGRTVGGTRLFVDLIRSRQLSLL